MTSRLPAPVDERDVEQAASAPWPLPLLASGLLAGVGWGIWLLHATGGRAGLSVALALLCLVPLCAVVRPWRSLPWWVTTAVLAPGFVALVLNPISVTGWQGLDDAAAWLYAGLLALSVATVASTSERRLALLVLVVIIGLEQTAHAWWSWFGGGDASSPWVGTYFLHNAFAGFLLAPASIAVVLAVAATGRARLFGLVCAPILGAAVVLSGSRAGLALLLAVIIVTGVGQVRTRTGWVRLLGVAAAIPLVARLLTLTVSSGTGNAAGALGARAEPAGSSLSIRVDYFTAAWRLWERHPIHGGGFGSFETAGAHLMPIDAPASSLVHNGWLQALADGGLLLTLPVVVVTGAAVLAGCQVLLLRPGVDFTRTAAAAAVVALGAHALFDVDWAYPALLATFALVAAVVLAPQTPVAERSPRTATTNVVLLAIAAVVGFGCAVLGAAQQAPLSALGAGGRALSHLGVDDWAAMLPTGPGDLATLRDLEPQTSEQVQQLQAAFDRTADAAPDDPVLGQARALALVRLRQPEEGLALSKSIFPAQPRSTTVAARADVLLAAGQRSEAVALVRAAVDRGDTDPSLLLAWLQRAGETADETQESDDVATREESA